MPSSVSGQNNYYASHHRRPSQHSYSNLSDQVEGKTQQVQSPNRSLIYLPATTYSQPSIGRNSNLTGSATVEFITDYADSSLDPHEFYRQDQNGQHGFTQEIRQGSSGGSDGLQQITSRGQTRRASSNSQFSPPTLYEASKSTPALSGTLRSRKTSFKDLVAKFDTDDVPPVPSRPGSRVQSTTVSPTITTMPPPFFVQSFQSRKDQSYAIGADPVQPVSHSQGVPRNRDNQQNHRIAPSNATSQSSTNLNISIPLRRPLFGEVLSGISAPSKGGYGIQNARRRRGSEGSPMHSPSPMFPSESMASRPDLSPISPKTWYTGSTQGSSSMKNEQPLSHPRPSPHRRARSDFEATHSGAHATQNPIRAPCAPNIARPESTDTVASEPKRNSQSRIPISNRHRSLTSESGHSPPSSRAASKQGKHPNGRVLPPSTAGRSSPKRDSPRRNQQSLTPIKSPGKRGQNSATAQSEKSPSLRANIIAPPPKISPPLRSSRPRLPVSSASTSASRAKLAEKFTSMQKQNSEKRQSSRKPQRPPELNDIDLQARRLKITQALTRSRQGLDLQGRESGSRRESVNVTSDSDTLKEKSPITEIGPESTSLSQVPVMVLHRTATDDSGESEAFHTPVDEFNPHSSALNRLANSIATLESQTHPYDIESPTLGHSDHAVVGQRSLSHLRMHDSERESEPCSAATTDTGETGGTPIDLEPQSGTLPLPLGRTVLSQIMRMRSQSQSSPHSFNSSHSDDAAHGRADEESIQIMLRDTNFLDGRSYSQEQERNQAESEGSYDRSNVSNQGRDSWTSSIQDQSSDDAGTDAGIEGFQQNTDGSYSRANHSLLNTAPSHSRYDNVVDLESIRSTMASDAYTIVNFVLQQHSTSGIVDNEVADHIYQRVINMPEQLTEQGTLDTQRFQQLCVEEIQNLEQQRQSVVGDAPSDQGGYARNSNGTIQAVGSPPPRNPEKSDEGSSHVADDTRPHTLLERPSYLAHRPKASLDSIEDFAETSPSIGSWMQFATHHSHPASGLNHAVYPDQDDTLRAQTFSREGEEIALATPTKTTENVSSRNTPVSSELGSGVPRPPSKSPPPPPSNQSLFYSQAIADGLSEVRSTSTITPSSTFPPHVPRRITSLSRMTARSSLDRTTSIHSLTGDSQGSDGRPSLDRPSLQSSASQRSSPTPEQRKLKQRRHVLKELIDTEARFEKDMKVLCDIYKETAYPTLSPDDIKVLFGNSEQILEFVIDFLGLLKQAARPAYTIDRSERFQTSKDQQAHSRAQSTAGTSSTAGDSAPLLDIADASNDRETRIGEAFELSLPNMAAAYAEYLKNHDAANKKLQSVQKQSLVREWLNECQKGSADLTNAWDLDSLMVKPVQRIMKYPLLLGQLIEATPADHPDLKALRGVLSRLTEINMRINDQKKHAELVGQVFNRKRKESDVRNGISKALGRRTEKLRQHVGISEMFEDREYNSLKHDYIENYGHLVVVSRDVQMYRTTITGWVNHMTDLGAAADAWVDVSHTRHTEAESKLRQFGMLVRGISTIALPDHLGEIQKRVIDPMEKAWKLLETLANDPKGLLQKRDKRLIDYARFKNMKDRGEKLDKKTNERIEQWEALNTEAKARMRKLLALTEKLVTAAQDTYVKLHLSWLDLCNRKFSAAMAIPLGKLEQLDIEKEWQIDFDYQHASALTLSVCNGSLLAEAANMVSFLTTPASTLNGDESPRPSWNSSNKRSISLNSDSTHALPLEYNKRHSGSFMASPLGANIGEQGQFAFSNGRLRAASTTSGQHPRTPEISTRGASLLAQTTASVTPGRPVTSSGSSTEPSPRLPRLSIDAPSPSFGPLRIESPPVRPESASTFFSAAGRQNHTLPNPSNRGSGVFSSAVPMAESPMSSQHQSFEEPERYYEVLFTAASVYEFNIDRSRREAGFPYLTYVAGEIFDIIGEKGELWLARNQDDPQRQVGWIWNKHFAKLAE